MVFNCIRLSQSLLLVMTAIKTQRPAETKFFSGFMGLFFGSFSLYKAFNKPLVFTTLDWTIIVGLVLAVLILVVIIDWGVLKRDK